MKFWDKWYYYGGMVGIIAAIVGIVDAILTRHEASILRFIGILAVSLYLLVRGIQAKRLSGIHKSSQ